MSERLIFFAMELLLPDDLISEYLETGYSSIDQIYIYTGYNKRLIELKLN